MVASVLITGCTDDGIGSALAIRFAQRGLVVFATARSLQRMTQLTNISNIHLLELDIQDAGQVRAVVEAIQHETGGKLNYLVNNAGQNRFTPLLDEDIEQVKKLFDVNVYGALRVTQACAPMLMATKGKVVFTSSVSGWLNVPWQGKQECFSFSYDDF
jgi:1-acylglycerone phosphate reductase